LRWTANSWIFTKFPEFFSPSVPSSQFCSAMEMQLISDIWEIIFWI
jgi:hypothetical protein